MNGVKEINNRNIYGPSLIMRGITSSQINTGHAFMIFLTFQIKHGLRNLEGENEYNKIPAICEVLNGVERKDDDINIVEYDCIGNQEIDQDLTDFTLGNIEEEDNYNYNSLKKTNLKELVTELKSKMEDLGELQQKQKSLFTFEDLLKIIVFKMDTKIKNISSDNYNFKININGQLNKEIVSTKPISLKRELELVEVDTKANCVFNLRLNKIADLSCDLNLENHKDIKTFSFKTSNIYTDNNSHEIYLAGFNDITLINSEKKENKENSEDNIILIIIIACSIVGAVLIALGIYCLIKRCKRTKSENETNKNNEKAVQLVNIHGN